MHPSVMQDVWFDIFAYLFGNSLLQASSFYFQREIINQTEQTL